MLDNTLTITTDIGGTPTAEDFNRDEEYLNRSVYTGTAHTLSMRDQLTLYRTKPKANGNFRGMAKSAAKFTKDITVPGVDGADIVAPLLGEVSFSLPVGFTAADSSLVRERIVALINEEAFIAQLVDQLRI